MQTELTDDPQIAAGHIKAGRLAAFPTETVYGLGSDVFNSGSIAKIFEAKQRPADNPLIAHIGDLAQIDSLASEIPPNAHKLIGEFFPGPLTLVLKKTERVPLIATAGLDTIGVRMPRNKLAREFLKACGTPVVAPSANLSGRPSPTTWQAVYEDLNGRIDCILRGETTEIGLESTVVDCTGDAPVILRPGAVTLEQLREVVPETRLSGMDSVESPRSPGMKHQHYSPQAEVRIVSVSEPFAYRNVAAYIGIHDPGVVFGLKQIVRDVESYAHAVFEFFRECDRKRIEVIYCEAVAEEGIGAALMDRIERAERGL